MTTYIIIMVVCLVFSAYFSATETAFSCMNKTRMKTLAEKGERRAALALKLVEKYDRLISTVLIGNNIVNITLSSVGTLFFIDLCMNTRAEDYAATITTVVVTVVVLIFGEITPKSIANDFPERFAMFSAPLLRILLVVLTPINLIFSGWKKLIKSMIKVEDDQSMDQEELRMIVEEAKQEGAIDSDESDLINNVMDFSDIKAEDILTHRVDIEALPVDATKKEIAQKFTETRYSRIPVYEDSIDNIIGVIHQKDFYVGEGIAKKAVRNLISPVLYIQKSERIDDLLRKLQNEKAHIAVVIDEYGGTLGIVTMEDILEELVGDIWDEHDEVVEEFAMIGEDVYLVDCNVKLDDFCEFFEVEPESGSISVGGFVLEQMGNIPTVGEQFTYEHLTVTVEEATTHRVVSVKVEWNRDYTPEIEE